MSGVVCPLQETVTTASILDTGNLVLVNNANQVVWQSFHTPTDTLLPTQSYTPNTTTTTTAWRSNYQLDGWRKLEMVQCMASCG